MAGELPLSGGVGARVRPTRWWLGIEVALIAGVAGMVWLSCDDADEGEGWDRAPGADDAAADGATGTRAKGEEGTMGNPSAPRPTGARYGVAGPDEAAEFGMIGLLNSGAGGVASPWGAPRVMPQPTLDPNARYSTTYRPGGGLAAPIDAAVAQGVVGASLREALLGASPPTEDVPIAAGRALGMVYDLAPDPAQPDARWVRVVLGSDERETLPRPKLGVHVVIDTSGSMQGVKLERSKEAVAALTRRLWPTDVMSVTAFSDDAVEVVEAGPVGPRRDEMNAAIDGLSANGGTNLHAGLSLAYEQAGHLGAEDGRLHVVMLVSDGLATTGDCDRDDIAALASNAFQTGVQTTTFGLGLDYDGPLMSALAEGGAGGYYFLASSGGLQDALDRELERRLDAAALGVELKVRLAPGVALLDVFGSRRLSDDEAARTRAQEVAVDAQMERREDIARDRDDDEQDGMRFFIPAFGRGDQHTFLLRVGGGAPADGYGTVTLRYKDRRTSANVVVDGTLSDSSGSPAAMAPTVARFQAGRALSRAAGRLRAGDPEGARSLLEEGAARLDEAGAELGRLELAEDAARLRVLSEEVLAPTMRSESAAMLLEVAGQARQR
jgi:Ca-activated chloride channel family protein